MKKLIARFRKGVESSTDRRSDIEKLREDLLKSATSSAERSEINEIFSRSL
jgi:hypothetical protein